MLDEGIGDFGLIKHCAQSLDRYLRSRGVDVRR